MRLFVIAHDVLRVMPKQLSVTDLVSFVNAYQHAAGPQITVLWALQSLLRLASLENLIDAFAQLNAELALPFAVSAETKENRCTKPADRISQAISSLAAVQAIGWQDFVDHTSQVERILSDDPASAYRLMSFETQDKYRAVVEKLRRGSSFSEADIARKMVSYASQASATQAQQQPYKAAHVGYWLVDRGRETPERDLSYKPALADRVRRHMLRHGRGGYALALLVGFLLAMLVPVLFLMTSHASFWSWLGGLGLSFLPARVLSMTLAQWLITAPLKPRVLPSMDYRSALPANCQTAITVPVIIGHERDVPAMLEQLEIRHLSNPDPMLHFILLSGLPDGKHENAPEDAAIERALVAGIENLNRQYGNSEAKPFYLMHRRRHYNPAETCWMGRKRNRGKLEQFSHYIFNGDVGEFCLCVGAIEDLRDCRFVVTLDADTMLSAETAAKMTGTLMHPLNAPEIDPLTGKVVNGYTIVQFNQGLRSAPVRSRVIVLPSLCRRYRH
jgi:cyclic beta-1,2-glucan synthetase